MNPDSVARQSLELLLSDWHALLQGWAISGALVAAAQGALQLPATPVALSKLVAQWAAGDFGGLPPIVLLPASSMPGAAGAYAMSTGAIYLNPDWLATASQHQRLAVLTEELGHHLDALLNAADSTGDEGELFAALLLEPAGLSSSQQRALRQQHDHGSLQLSELSSLPLAVELAESSPSYEVRSTPIASASYYRSLHEVRNAGAVAALRSDGSVVSFGYSGNGGNSSGVDFNGPNNNLRVTQIFSTATAFAALRSDGSVVTWGGSGGNSSGVDFNGPNDNLKVTRIFSNREAFAALRSDGSVVTWGNSYHGGNSSRVDFDGPNDNLRVTQIFSTPYAFAALRNDGSVVAWGYDEYGLDWGGNSRDVDFDGPNNNLTVMQIFSTNSGFAALRSDGSVVTWGGSGGNSGGVDFNGPNDNLLVTQIVSTATAFSALRSDGSVVTWGNWSGGNSGVDFDGPNNNLAVTQIFANYYTFAALRSDGSVVSWGDALNGGNSSDVDFDGPNDNLKVTQIFSAESSFAALRSDDSLVSWGYGISSGFDFDGPNDNLKVTQIFSGGRSGMALRSDGSVVTWAGFAIGNIGADFDGPSSNLRVTQIEPYYDGIVALRSDGSVVASGDLDYVGNVIGVDFDGANNNLTVTQVFSTPYAFAALRSDGSVVSWGDYAYGGDSSGVDFNGPNDNLTVTQIFSTDNSFAALRSDGSVVTWGHSDYGGNSSGVDFNGPNDNLTVAQIFSADNSFAALRSDGSVVTWGHSDYGGNSSGVDFNGPNDNLTVTQIFSTDNSFAALRSDGSVVTWGKGYGGNSYGVDFNGPNDDLTVTRIFSTGEAFAALRSDGSVVSWGNSYNDAGNSSAIDFDGPNNNLTVTQIFSANSVFAALRSDGSVVTWGGGSGGNSSGADFNGPNDNLVVKQIFSTSGAYVALRSDGSVVTWGDWSGENSGVDFDGPNNNLAVTQISSTYSASAALRSDGSVVSWGGDWGGGNSSGVDFDGPSNNLKVTQIFAAKSDFAALRSDGSVITWGLNGDAGEVDFDGPNDNLKVTQIFSNGNAFAALRSDGSVVTWGYSNYGGSSNGVDFDGPDNNLKIASFANPFTDDWLIIDDAAPWLPSITLVVSSAAVTEDGTTSLVFTFARTGAITEALSINYTVGGTATLVASSTDEADYTGISTIGSIKTITFAAGSATATLMVDPIADSTSEADETVALTLAAGSEYLIGTTAAVTGVISNDDVVSQPMEPGDYSNDPANPSPMPWSGTGSPYIAKISNLIGTTSDRVDYLTFDVLPGQKLTSIVLDTYNSVDSKAFIGLQRGSAITASVNNPSPLLGYTHFGSGQADAAVGHDLIAKLGGPLSEGAYSIWIQQLGGQTEYAFTLTLEQQPADAGLTIVDLPENSLTGTSFLVSDPQSSPVNVYSVNSPDHISVQAPVVLELTAQTSSTHGFGRFARNVGTLASPGTGQLIFLNGLGQYSFVATAIPEATTTINLEPTKNTAFFLHDAYSAFYEGLLLTPDSSGRQSTQRVLNVDTIKMGSAGGTSIVDLTSKDYVTGAVTVYGANQGCSIFWGTSSNDTFISGGGDSVIFGGGGSNQATLSGGRDTLQYRAGVIATDRVSGFVVGQDKVELWSGRNQVVTEPSFALVNGSTIMSWGGNSVEFVGVTGLNLSNLLPVMRTA